MALGHNREDYVETFLMNLFYAGKADTFKPLTYLDRKDITVIRPLLSVPEDLLRRHAQNVSLPVMENPCPADGKTTREDMRLLLEEIQKKNDLSIELAFRGLERLEIERRKGKEE